MDRANTLCQADYKPIIGERSMINGVMMKAKWSRAWRIGAIRKSLDVDCLRSVGEARYASSY